MAKNEFANQVKTLEQQEKALIELLSNGSTEEQDLLAEYLEERARLKEQDERLRMNEFLTSVSDKVKIAFNASVAAPMASTNLSDKGLAQAPMHVINETIKIKKAAKARKDGIEKSDFQERADLLQSTRERHQEILDAKEAEAQAEIDNDPDNPNP